ncbi:hypothetical protein SAMN05421749_103291 [Acinetobacter marinus]|uniref:Uncharacterized protein n=1 Tax=Acinetobacter marinus TaxID=281375 RepID=A0A1G6JA42_9GAMM|nr:hypothetical protein [Acinetobacter marinus]SDC15654.1 hypothetical protein SAMN05421749_103291 [Acinetobacter marinus]
MTEAREAFGKYQAKMCQVSYEELKARYDEFERISGERYLSETMKKQWSSWLASWQVQQKRIDVLQERLSHALDAVDEAENYLHVALNSVDDETLCKSYLLSTVNALRGGSHD